MRINIVSEAGIKGKDKYLHPTDTVGCNYLSLPLILASRNVPEGRSVAVWGVCLLLYTPL